MNIVLQRVSSASVQVNGTSTGSIGHGLLLLLGVHQTDNKLQAAYLAEKCAHLRIFSDDTGKMNRSVIDVNGSALVVSQFTLLGNCSKGRRPSFASAAPPERGRALYEHFTAQLRHHVSHVETGVFGANMKVSLVNDGPVTLLLEH